jgi:hypothetical protein
VCEVLARVCVRVEVRSFAPARRAKREVCVCWVEEVRCVQIVGTYVCVLCGEARTDGCVGVVRRGGGGTCAASCARRSVRCM